jgi:glutathione S-transferase
MQRYTGETERLYGVLDRHLESKEYIVGNKYSIVDINSFGWVNALRFSGIDLDRFPNVQSWWRRINSRPTVERGLSIPQKSPFGNDSYVKRLKDDEDFAKQEKQVEEQIQAAKDRYGYRYASP